MILIGTSGYSYTDWVGTFYPPGTKRADMLAYYARMFPLAELDFTYYQMPGIRAIQGLAAKSPPRFQFAVKANRQITHSPAETGTERREICNLFWYSLAPLYETQKLSCILLQFPQSFHKTPRHLDRLRELRECFSEAPLVAEFRHQSWMNQETFEFLRKEQYNFCCVDEPALPGLFPPLAVATGPLAYLRFHGRNKDKWWNHKEAWERYDYLYNEAELKEWLPKIKSLERASQNVLVLFNNCHFGQAARNALKLQQLLLDIG